MTSEACPACLFQGAHSAKRRSVGLDVLECKECGMVFTSPLNAGNADEVGHHHSSQTRGRYYAAIVRDHDLQEEAARRKLGKLLEAYRLGFGFTPTRVLEVGCGTGQYYRAWQEHGVDWLGVEANPGMLDFCKANGKPVVDASAMQTLSAGSFDLIYMSQVLEHVLEPGPLLVILRQVLADNGLLHIDVPNHDSLASWLRRINPGSREFGFIQPPHHLLAYRPRSLAGLLRRNGYSVELIRACANDDEAFGQLLTKPSWPKRLAYRVSELLGAGSLLVALARVQTPTGQARLFEAP